MLRRVGPEQVAHLSFVTSVVQTERHADHEGSGGSGAAAPRPDRLSDPAGLRRPLYSGRASARGGPDLMPPTSLSAVVRQVRKLAAPGDLPAAPDADLLARFRASGDEAAFAALVRRHGPLVMGVCRRVLRRVAGDARRAATRRQARERRATTVGHAQPDLEAAWRELQAVLADEVERLPQKYQLPFVLCCLEGKSKAEAAAQLGWKEGTVSSRLAEARKRMQQRLARRGLTLTVALCAVAATAGTAPALPAALVTTTVGAALGARVGTAAGASARAAALANGVTKALFASKVKTATALLLAVALLAAAVGSQMHRAAAEPPAREAAPPAEAKADKAPPTKPEKADAPADPFPRGGVLRLGATRLRHGCGVRQQGGRVRRRPPLPLGHQDGCRGAAGGLAVGFPGVARVAARRPGHRRAPGVRRLGLGIHRRKS